MSSSQTGYSITWAWKERTSSLVKCTVKYKIILIKQRRLLECERRSLIGLERCDIDQSRSRLLKCTFVKYKLFKNVSCWIMNLLMMVCALQWIHKRTNISKVWLNLFIDNYCWILLASEFVFDDACSPAVIAINKCDDVICWINSA